MATLSYSVASTNPISIYPAGQQGEVTVFNNSANRVMIASDAGGLIGIPLDGGNSIKWDAATPLYAFVTDTAKPATVYVIDSGVTLPSTNVTATIPGTVAVTGAVSANANVSIIYNSGYGTPASLFPPLTVDTHVYNTIILALSQNSPLAGENSGHLNLQWQDSVGTAICTDTLFVEISATYCQVGAQHRWTIPVKGARLVMSWSPYTGTFNAQNNFVLYGTTAQLPSAYYYNGWTAFNFPQTNDAGSLDLYTAAGTVGAAGSYADAFPVVSGAAQVWIYSSAATTFILYPAGAPNAATFAVDVPAATQKVFSVILPTRPVRAQFNTGTASTNCNFGFTYTEPY